MTVKEFRMLNMVMIDRIHKGQWRAWARFGRDGKLRFDKLQKAVGPLLILAETPVASWLHRSFPELSRDAIERLVREYKEEEEL